MEADRVNKKLPKLTIVIMAAAVAVMWLVDAAITRPGFDHLGGMSDLVNIRLYMQKLEEPGLYPRDYLYASTDVARQYTPSYRYLLSALSQLTGNMGNALVVLTPILAFVYMLTMTLFLRNFTSSRLNAVLLAAVSTVPHYSPGGDFWGTGGLYSALPRTIFATVTPLLLLVHLRFSSTMKGCALSLALAGAAANLHPISGAILAEILLFERFMATLRRRFPFKGLILGAACFLICALPFMLGFFGIMGRHNAPGMVADPSTFYAAVWIRFSHMLLPPGKDTVWPFVEAFLPLLPFAALGAFSVRQEHKEKIHGLLRLLGSLLIVVLGGLLALQWLAQTTGWSFMLVDQMRGLRLAYPMAFALAASGLQEICRRLPRWLAVLAAFAVALWLLPVLALPSLEINPGHVPRPVKYGYWYLTGRANLARMDIQDAAGKPRAVDIKEAAKWAGENTPLQALFLCEDARFRLFSRRSAAYAFKDGGTAYYLGKGTFMEWARREAAVRVARQSREAGTWIDLASRLGCDYVVIDKETIEAAPLAGAVYQNSTFAIVPVKPPQP